jgi:hypothetical protein
MPLLDDRGRLFGKVNLIDAAVALFVLLLIPLGYGAYALFRDPPPVIAAVAPRTVKNVKGEMIEIQGENLRPFLRATFGPYPVEYLFATPDRAKLTVPELAEGDYELILYDEAQEVARGGTVSIRAPAPPARPPDPLAAVAVVGAFHLDAADVGAVSTGARFPATRDSKNPATDWIEIVAVRPPVAATIPLVDSHPVAVQFSDRKQVEARVRLQGHMAGRELTFGDKRVLPNVELLLPREEPPRPAGQPDATGEGVSRPPAKAKPPITFVIHRIHPEQTTPVDVQVRFIVRPDVLALVQRDIVQQRSDPFRTLLPQVLSLDPKMTLTGDTKNDLKEGTVQVVEGLVRFPAVRTADGWSYDNRVIRPGTDIAVETPAWGLIGNVLSMAVRSDAAKR